MSDYEQMLEESYRGFLRPGDACVDVGAHVGRHTLPIAQCEAPSGRVFAFEPLPEIAQQLRGKMAASPDLQALIHFDMCALSDTSGTTAFTFVQNNPGYSGFLPRHYDAPSITATIEVEVRRLDDLAASLPRIRYIKIDCEGGELRVLRGAHALLQRDRPIVSFECGDASLESYDYTAADIFDFWHSHDYAIQSITQQRLDRAGFIKASAEQSFWDYIAISR